MSHTHQHRYKVEVTWTGNQGTGTKTYQGYGRGHEIRIGFRPLAHDNRPRLGLVPGVENLLVGNGLDFRMGRSLKYKKVAHNRLLMSLAHGMGHHIDKFGNPDFCKSGPLSLT